MTGVQTCALPIYLVIDRRYVEAAAAVCPESPLSNPTLLQVSIEEYEHKVGKLLSASFGRGTSEMAFVYLRIAQDGANGTVGIALPLRRVAGKLRPCPAPNFPLGAASE